MTTGESPEAVSGNITAENRHLCPQDRRKIHERYWESGYNRSGIGGACASPQQKTDCTPSADGIRIEKIKGYGGDEMENSFTAKRVNFQGVPGFMVCQYHGGVKVCEQFVSASAYAEFCEAAGIEPEIIE